MRNIRALALALLTVGCATSAIPETCVEEVCVGSPGSSLVSLSATYRKEQLTCSLVNPDPKAEVVRLCENAPSRTATYVTATDRYVFRIVRDRVARINRFELSD